MQTTVEDELEIFICKPQALDAKNLKLLQIIKANSGISIRELTDELHFRNVGVCFAAVRYLAWLGLVYYKRDGNGDSRPYRCFAVSDDTLREAYRQYR